MVDLPTNDNDVVRTGEVVREPDAHGQSAMLLVESLMHVLVARSVLSVADAAEAVTVAIDAKAATGEELGDSPATLQQSLAILEAVGASLSIDLPREVRET